jgi:hypothetical protein
MKKQKRMKDMKSRETGKRNVKRDEGKEKTKEMKEKER